MRGSDIELSSRHGVGSHIDSISIRERHPFASVLRGLGSLLAKASTSHVEERPTVVVSVKDNEALRDGTIPRTDG